MAKIGKVGFLALSKLNDETTTEKGGELIKLLAKKYPSAEGLFIILPK